MNMKKISALALALVMSAASIASAATFEEEVADYAPEVAITVSDDPVDNATIKSIAAANYYKKIDTTANDYYKMTFKITNVGALENDGVTIKGIGGISVGLKTDKIISASAKNVTAESLKYDAGYAAATGLFSFKFNGDASNPFPAYDADNEAAINEYDGDTFTMNFIVAIAKGTSVTVNEFKGWVTYTDGVDGVDKFFNNVAPVTIGTPASTVKDWDVTITEEADQPNGYIWKAVATPGDGKLTKFDVTFTDTNAATLTKSIADTETLGGWNTDLTFFVGLSTDKTAHPGVTAAWDIAVNQGKVNIK